MKRTLAGLFAALLSLPGFGVQDKGAPPALDADAKGFVDAYCLKCHSPEKSKGKLDVSLVLLAGSQKEPRFWRKIEDRVREGAMPPDDSPQPPAPRKAAFLAWLKKARAAADAKLAPDPGRTLHRRLTREEYNNTVRDLLGVTLRPADRFPADGGGGKGFDNNAETLFVPPLLLENYYQAAGDLILAADAKHLCLVKADAEKTPKLSAHRIISDFATRAFRRPPEAPLVDRWTALYESLEKKGVKFDEAVKTVLRGMLTSPNFLFRVESDQPLTEPWPVDGYELANRLSYLLWSSMPDDALFALAADQKLKTPEAVKAETLRMIADPKSRSFARNFASQWLHLSRLETTIRPDPKKFPEFTPSLRDAMIDEATEFLWALFRENGSLIDLIHADYTYVNEELAKHYGIAGVSGPSMRKVTLTDPNRGGVLGFAGVLTLTSHPARTSPVVRGKWILETLLDDPPQPPPPNIPPLPSDDAPVQGLTLREQLEKHRQNPVCAGCHRSIDPVGFALENFDPIGRWRTEIQGKPVVSESVLPTGEKFSKPSELKEILLKKKEAFVRSITENMLAYALGRGIQTGDESAVDAILAVTEKDGYRAQTWLTEITRSYPFRYRRNATAGGR
ncbi:MAG TPA: DUF1592 domain-containing protein [Planctomycetota bacterium]|nr:DUF1592 domain-containing protein [Planctomycetota bacterium]